MGLSLTITALWVSVSCASGPKKVAVVPEAAPPPKPTAAPDPAAAVLAESDEALRSGLAAADAGHLDRARADFDRAVDVLLSYPGGAGSEPRLAEAYRRTLETIQVREIEMLAAGDGFTEIASEPASIDVVGALPVGDAPASEETRAQAVAAVAAEKPDLPVELNEAVLSCIDLYQGRLRDWFDAALVARPAGTCPTSARCSPRRASRRTSPTSPSSRAPSSRPPTRGRRPRGVWQFISATGRRYGLQQDWWVDERSDPEKATRAAARYLKELYVMFGDWNLALAGYNAGEMKVVRAMKKYNTSDFWELRRTRGFRRETKNYVPLIHAAIVIAKSPERYGFTVAPDEPPDFERVPIEGAFDLRVIAECAGEPLETIRSLNPRAAPPGDARRPHVPAQGADRPRRGARPSASASSPRRSGSASGRTSCGAGRPSPASPAPTASPPATSPRPTASRPASASARGTELIIPIPAPLARRHRPARRAAGDASDAGRVRYKIRPGDTLASIAAQYGTTVDRLCGRGTGCAGRRSPPATFLTIYTAASRN